MASVTERLGYIITANGKDAVREFRSVRDSAKRDLGGTETLLGRFNANASGIGAGLKGFGAGIIASLGVGSIGALTDAASGLEQSAGAIESVFGDAKTAIEEFGETAAETAGLSKREVNEMASVIGAQLQGMGFTVDESAQQVIGLQKRAADMAATFGGDTRKAIEAISSALRKERDPIEQYGVTIGEADVKTRAAALGLDTTTVASQKYANAMATLDIILERTAKTQGQFTREADSAAGAQARAAAEYENAKAKLGDSLLPAQTAVTKGLTHFVRGVSVTGDAVSNFIGGLGDLIGAGDDAAESQREVAEATSDAGNAAADATVSVEDYKAALDELQSSAFDVKGAQDDVTQSILALTDLAVDSDRKRSDSADKVADAIQRANERIRDAERSVRDARRDAGKVNVPGAERDAANERLREAEERLADVRAEAEANISKAREAREEFDEWTPALDRATEAGLKNRDRMQEIVDRVLTTAEKMKEQGASSNEINGYLTTQRNLIGDVATQAGFSRDAMREYLDLLRQASQLEASRPQLPSVGGVVGPWSDAYANSMPQLPTVNGVQGPYSPVYVQINGVANDPQHLAELVTREVSRQLRRRA